MDSDMDPETSREDRISYLPEDVIGQILSYLPTKEAVRTSTLSKAWRNQWTNIRDIRFDVTDLYLDPRSMEFIDRVLTAIGDSQLRSFQLECDAYGDCKDHQARRMLTLLRSKPNLEELNLSLTATIELSPLSSLSNLTSLRLDHLKIITNDPSPFVLDCPALKTLTLSNCQWRNFEEVYIDSPLLETLRVENCGYINGICRRAHEPDYCEFNVMAPRLKEFYYCGGFFERFLLSNPSSVSLASIRFSTWEGQFPCMHLAGFSLLRSFLNLTHLILEVPLGSKALVQILPEFSKLISMELYFNDTAESLIILLNSVPRLQSLTIVLRIPSLQRDWTDAFTRETVVYPPTCLIFTLSYVEIRYCYSYSLDVELAKYILQFSRALQRMVLRPHHMALRPRAEEAVSDEVKALILSFHKDSRDASVVFIES